MIYFFKCIFCIVNIENIHVNSQNTNWINNFVFLYFFYEQIRELMFWKDTHIRYRLFEKSHTHIIVFWAKSTLLTDALCKHINISCILYSQFCYECTTTYQNISLGKLNNSHWLWQMLAMICIGLCLCLFLFRYF